MMNPLEDGTTHINVHFNAKTQLGRMLCPSYDRLTFRMPDGETYRSVEDYASKKDETLHATWQKVRQNERLFWRFKQSYRPFRRYKVERGVVCSLPDSSWLTDGLTVMEEYTDKKFW